MKLYTEEQIRQAISFGLKQYFTPSREETKSPNEEDVFIASLDALELRPYNFKWIEHLVEEDLK